MGVDELCADMLKSPGKEFDVGGAVTLALEIPVYLGELQPDIIEIVSRCDGVNVGFVMLMLNTEKGELLLENPLWAYQRPNLDYSTGVGIEVHPDFQRRRIAAAMLSTAITVARSRIRPDAPVVARNATDALQFYRDFGFDIIETPVREGVIHYGARYVKSDVPEINIKLPSIAAQASAATK